MLKKNFFLKPASLLKKIRFIVNYYLFFFKLNYLFLFFREDNTFLWKNFFLINIPTKQLIFSIYFNDLDYSKHLTTGAFLKWQLVRAKFYKKRLESITPILLLFWQNYRPFFAENVVIYIRNFNFFVYKFLLRLFEVLDLTPSNIIFFKSYKVFMYKTRRIKKKVLKLINKY